MLKYFLKELSHQKFKRSFVPISQFKWTNLWSISSLSFWDRRDINETMSRCIMDLQTKTGQPEFNKPADEIKKLSEKYENISLRCVSAEILFRDRKRFFACVSLASRRALLLTSDTATAMHSSRTAQSSPEDKDPFRNECDEVLSLPGWLQSAEQLICLMYIGFIHSVVARMHFLLTSIAFAFSLLVIGTAIYPFVPFAPLLVAGVAWIVLIALTFYKVFSELRSDPVLSRIVNAEDGTKQFHLYAKFAEALALPLLALASTVLPGGAGRLLELAESILNHAQ